MTTNVAIAGASAGRYDLLHGGSEVVDLSFLAARTSAALRRLSHGGVPSAEDEEVLHAMAQLLSDAAHAMQFFDSGGREGSPPSGALAARVDATIDAVLDERIRPAQQTVLSQQLSQLAARLQASGKPWSSKEAIDLGDYFSALARAVLNQAGHVGEVTATL
jgi:hypothetical protein